MASLPIILFHLFALAESVFSLKVYKSYVVVNRNFSYGGDWKFLTYINLVVKLLYFAFCVLEDVAKALRFNWVSFSIRKPKQFLFAALGLPLTMIVFIMFWGLYAIDRELVHPADLDDNIPQWANHLWHTAILLIVVEVATTHHTFPKRRVGMVFVVSWGCAYIVWISWIYSKTGRWIYPFLAKLNAVAFAVFVLVEILFACSIYALGEFLNKFTDTLVAPRSAERQKLTKNQ